jgi:hypothetical protein
MEHPIMDIDLKNSPAGRPTALATCLRSALLVASLSFAMAPASAQLFGAQDSPWAGLRDVLGKNKAQEKAPAQPKTQPNSGQARRHKGTQAAPTSADDEQDEDDSEDDSSSIGTAISADGRRGIWSLVLETPGTVAWLNDRDMVPQNGAVMVSVLFEHDPAMLLANGTSFRSAKARIRIDCSAQPATIIGLTLFSKRGGDGRVVGEQMRPFALKTAPSGVAVEAKLREMTKSSCTTSLPDIYN